MPYEIEMLSVGAADAIILKYFNASNQEIVILIDAGNKKDGKKIVDNINKWTEQKYIDLAICTHPDGDHIGGFFYVVEHLRIEEFWIHDPSNHRSELDKLRNEIHESDILEKSLKYVIESLDYSTNLLSIIDSKGIKRDVEPFAGLEYKYAPLRVIGPTKDYYLALLSRFRDINSLYKEEELLEKSMRGDELITESLNSQQLLDRDNERSKENNSSVVLLFEPEDKKYLFTSDAGPEALKKAHDEYDLSSLDWLDVPHHGSRYNLTTELINIFKSKISYISCDGSKHYPSPAVVKELRKAGSKIYSTASGSKLHRRGTDLRPGYTKAIPL